MTEKSVSEVLRKLLDERGVEYKVDERNAITEWSTHYGAFVFFARQREGKLLVETTVATEHSVILTPEQAIAATLGSGTCNPVETATLENATAHVMECDACGRTYEHVNGDYERCPRCGKAVMQ